MKQVGYRLGVVGMMCLAQAAQGGLIFQEGFEGPAARYSVERGGIVDNTHFFTTLPQGSLALGYTPGNVQGSGYFGGRDIDGVGTGAAHRIIFDTVDTSPYRNLSIAIALAAGRNGYEISDEILLEYSLDGGASYSKLDLFTGDGGAPLANAAGTVLGNAFIDFSYPVPDAAQLTFRLRANGFGAIPESFALDNVRISGDPLAASTALPEPGTLLLVGIGLAGVLCRHAAKAKQMPHA